jgi:mRNA-degrading endonuclease RelE of RelBE toxin-antitoxin system
MKVNVTEPAEIVLRNLSDDDRRRVWAWINNLERWETDPFIQEQSKKLDAGGNDYMLVTNTDLRIFFTLEKESITVLDVAKKATIISSGKISGAGSQ